MGILRTGVLGGSFDPVHNGHLEMAKVAADRFSLNRILFLPAGISPFKPDGPAASGPDRVKMLRLAIAATEWRDGLKTEISEIELKRPGKSFTYDSMKILRDRAAPEERFFLIMGADLLPELPKWHNADRLVSEFDIILFARPGCKIPDSLPGMDPDAFRHVKKMLIADFRCAASSSEIRAVAAAGRIPDGFTPRPVAEYIYRRKLYARSSLPFASGPAVH